MSTVTPPPPPPPEERRRPFQFSMATLMGTVTLASVGLAVFVTLPFWAGVFLLRMVQVVFTAFLVAGAFFANKTMRTFCLGALAIYVLNQLDRSNLAALRFSFLQYSIWQSVLDVGSKCLMAVLGGWICVRARRFWENRTP